MNAAETLQKGLWWRIVCGYRATVRSRKQGLCHTQRQANDVCKAVRPPYLRKFHFDTVFDIEIEKNVIGMLFLFPIT